MHTPSRADARWAPPLLALGAVLGASGCSALASIPSEPPQTPSQWLHSQPVAELGLGPWTVIIVQPSTTIIVYALGVVTMAAGWGLLRRRGVPRARRWLGVAFLLWGAGALAAGTSYEAFSYQLKCVGHDVCRWTSGWEIAYLLLTMASVNAMVVAQSYAGAHGRRRDHLIRYAIGHTAAYSVVVAVGAFTPIAALVSFEGLLIAAVPSAVLCLWISVRGYRASRRRLDRVLLTAWVWMALIILAYYAYLVSGLTQQLWHRGLWFSENDVLHLGLIGWVVYVAVVAGPLLTDQLSEG